MDRPVKKKPIPPKLTAMAQKILLIRLDPLINDFLTESVYKVSIICDGFLGVGIN